MRKKVKCLIKGDVGLLIARAKLELPSCNLVERKSLVFSLTDESLVIFL